MSSESQVEDKTVQTSLEREGNSEPSTNEILCPHCLRTATNDIKCKGSCVADSGY